MISIPYETYIIESSSQIYSLVSYSGHSLVACLLEKSVQIRDSKLSGFPIISFLERSEKSFNEFGRNHWIHWVDSNIIAFGTCSGTVFISTIKNGKICDPLTIKLNSLVTSTFIAFRYLGLCFSDKKIVFLDSKGNIVSKIPVLFAKSPLKNAKFVLPSTLVCIIEDRPCKIMITQSVIEGDDPLQYSYFPINNCNTLSFSNNCSLVSSSTNDGSCLLLNDSAPNAAPIILINKDDNNSNEIIYNEWNRDGSDLCIIQRDSTVSLWISVTNSVHKVKIPDIGKGITFAFSNNNHQLFFSNNENILCIDFITFDSFIGFTPHKAINISKNICLASVGDTLKPDMFPINGVICTGSSFLIWSKSLFVILGNQGNLSRYVMIDILNACYFCGMIVVFSHSSEGYGYVVAFFDTNGKELGWFSISHAPLFVVNCGDRIVFSSNTKYSILKKSKSEIGTKTIIMDDSSINIKIKSFMSSEQILGAFYYDNHKTIIHQMNGNITILDSQKVIEKKVQRAFYFPENKLAIMHNFDSYTVLFMNNVFKFKGTFAITDGSMVFNLPNIFEYGNVRFNHSSYLPYVLLAFSENKEKFMDASFLFSSFPQFSWSLSQALLLALTNERLSLFIDSLVQLSSDIVSSVFNFCFSQLKDEQIIEITSLDIPWGMFCSKIDSGYFPYLFIHTTNDTFLSIIETLSRDILTKTSQKIKSIIKDLMNVHSYMRSLKLSIAYGVSLQEMLTSNELTYSYSFCDSVSIMISEKKKWEKFNLIDDFRFLASTFLSANIPCISLAIYLIFNDDRRIKSVLISNEALILMSKNFVEKYPDTDISSTLKNYLERLTK